MIIYPCGNYRSASTGVRHLINEMVKNHHKIKVNNDYPHQEALNIKLSDEDIIVYTYRDVRNVISSFIRKKEDKVKNNNFGSYSKLTILGKKPIDFLLKYYIKTDEIIKEKALQNPKNYIIFRYETDIKDMKSVLKKLSDRLNIPCDYSLLENSLTTVENFINDPNWSVHVSDGKSDFKKTINENDIKEIESNEEIRKWLQKNNYDLYN